MTLYKKKTKHFRSLAQVSRESAGFPPFEVEINFRSLSRGRFLNAEMEDGHRSWKLTATKYEGHLLILEPVLK